jgi:hypothetical protein
MRRMLVAFTLLAVVGTLTAGCGGAGRALAGADRPPPQAARAAGTR